MQSDIFQRLSDPLRAMVTEIERATGFEIQVLPRSDRSGGVRIVEEANTTTVGALTDAKSAIIEYSGAIEDVSDLEFAHELLHLQRSYVARIPHLFPRDSRTGPAAAAIENWLEHIVMYRKQIELFPSFQESLDAQTITFWNKFPTGLTGQQLRFNAISRYMGYSDFGVE